jgi:hypothetical protein
MHQEAGLEEDMSRQVCMMRTRVMMCGVGFISGVYLTSLAVMALVLFVGGK